MKGGRGRSGGGGWRGWHGRKAGGSTSGYRRGGIGGGAAGVPRKVEAALRRGEQTATSKGRGMATGRVSREGKRPEESSGFDPTREGDSRRKD